MTFRLKRVCALLFFSGACALTFQVAWFRELRLIFGASTAASAAVLAVFMGGLGIGGLVLGKRAEKAANPLALYALLEIGVAITAAAAPLLVWAAEKAYLAVGGAEVLGDVGATAMRIVLSLLVLAPSTVLMGGTLPAAAKSVERESDVGRHRVAALYGVNTLGAVAGCLAANFLLLEVFGTHLTQWIAALVNVLVGVLARSLSRAPDTSAPERAATAREEEEESGDPAPSERVPWFPPLAAAVSGFAFMLMELVWYRMLAPILGGSSYTFGLILAVALVGIGVGGAAYARSRATPTLRTFALTCAVEALVIALPYALGDRIAMLSLLLRPLCNSGFAASVAVWAVVTAIVVLPAAIVSGVQFPVVIGLYGHGSRNVAQHVGRAYFANTAGAIVGSIAGGFGLLPLLSAPVTWRVVVLVLAATTALAMAADVRVRGRAAFRGPSRLVAPLAGVLALASLLARGPTALWRHSGIGAGRADGRSSVVTRSHLESFEREVRGAIEWEEDGRESSVALENTNGYAFIVNGKADGHVIADAGTQVMGGLVGALLHPGVKNAMVIGLGTGSTAGWLGKIPSVDRVDVVELEPAILRVARDCAPVNENVLDNPKVKIRIADAREALLTTRHTYDLIFSEPSNPYRAGISSLYTVEFYRAAAGRLEAHGLFLQWIQAYEVDAWTVSTAITTLHDVFPTVSMWQTQSGDLLLVAQKDEAVVDVARLRARLAEEPFRRAAETVWATSTVEGVLEHHVAGPALTAFVLEKGAGVVNQDDQNLLEFAFARGLGQHRRVDEDFIDLARRLPGTGAKTTGPIDPRIAIEEGWMRQTLDQRAMSPPIAGAPPELAPLGKVLEHFRAARYEAALREWKKLGRKAVSPLESLLVAYGAARVGDPVFAEVVDGVRGEANRALLRALHAGRGGARNLSDVVAAFERAFVAMRTDPWGFPQLITDVIHLAPNIASANRQAAAQLHEALSAPFAAEIHHHARLAARARIAHLIGPDACVKAIDAFDPLPWDRQLFEMRASCYSDASDPRAAAAAADLGIFLEQEASIADLAPRAAPRRPPDEEGAAVDAGAD